MGLMLIICSPCNPTGAVYSQEELDSLAEVILRHENIYVISMKYMSTSIILGNTHQLQKIEYAIFVRILTLYRLLAVR